MSLSAFLEITGEEMIERHFCPPPYPHPEYDKLFHDIDPYHIETRPLKSMALQMGGASLMKELKSRSFEDKAA